MKSKTIMVLLATFSIVLIMTSNSMAENFSFGNIDWNDTPQIIFSKMKGSGLISDNSSFFNDSECSGELVNVIKTPMVDKELYDYLVHQTTLPNRMWKEEINKTNHLPLNGKTDMYGKSDSIVKDFDFIFTCDGKLLSYTINLRLNFSKEEAQSGNGEFYRGLVEAYEEPIKMRYSKKWAGKSKTLYYFFANPQMVFVTYLNNELLEQKINEIKKLIGIFEDKQSNKEKDSVKKMF
jgi:hypothetical protein